MKKSFLVLSLTMLLSVCLFAFKMPNSPNSTVSQIADEDEVVEIGPNKTFYLGTQGPYNSGTSGVRIIICPGSGATCTISLTVEGHTMVYTGTKTPNGDDYTIVW